MRFRLLNPRAVLLILGLFHCTEVCKALPAQVIVIRHAEKPKDPDALHLSEPGKRRAAAFVNYLKENPRLTTNGLPVALIASAAKKNGNGQRAGETLQPLAADLKMPVLTPYDSDEYFQLARRVLTSPAYDGKCVLICWTHENIPALIEALGVHPAPKKMGDKAYDHVYLIHYKDGKASLEELQHKMPRESGKRKKRKKNSTDTNSGKKD